MPKRWRVTTSLATRGIRGGAELWVIARNGAGLVWPLFPVSTPEEGTDRAQRIQTELVYLEPSEWCDRYHVPHNFAGHGRSAEDKLSAVVSPEWLARHRVP
jgi:hypothetical protein